MKFNIQNKFIKELPADPNRNNTRRQVKESCFSFVSPKTPSYPKLIHASKELAAELGLTASDLISDDFRDVFSGAKALTGSSSYAMCYGGHQFGSWAGQLGDGRAINLAEIENKGKTWMLQLKGAGPTPYSRNADGLAVLRSSIREHLCSEAMFHLGVPTTRSLSLMLSGDEVLRDMMYDGNSAYEKGAIVCRVAPSFIRFGNFEIFASRGDVKTLRELTDFTIKHYYPEIITKTKTKYLEFFEKVANQTREMIIHWQRVGFVHGVMNTDNMSIFGLTIDYGPYGWLEGYDPGWTPNTTDRQHKRYRFGNQPNVALWNLVKLANALYPLVEESEPFERILQKFGEDFKDEYLSMMNSKLGLEKMTNSNIELILQLEEALKLSETDMTIFFRNLSDFTKESNPEKFLSIVREAFYKVEEISAEVAQQWKKWFGNYSELLKIENRDQEERAAAMKKINPKYVLRNYMAQVAIDAADDGDYSVVEELFNLLKSPYEEQVENEKWFVKRPEWARHKVGCSMLSCSS